MTPDPDHLWRRRTAEDHLVRLPATLPIGSDLPLYVRLAVVLTDAVAAGVFTRGDQLPRLSALARRYGCSPPTVRAAIDVLVGLGVVRRLPGGKAIVI